MGLLHAAPDRLRADLRRHYGLNLSHPDVGLLDLADLAANLPEDSTVWRSIDPKAEWTTNEWLLARIVDAVEFIQWSKTKAATRNGASWKSTLPRPGIHKRTPTYDTGPKWTPDHLDDVLSKPRTAAPTT